MRTFETGATRDTDQGKLDFEGFLSPLALRRFAEYMHQHRFQADGVMRDSDNWQKGIPMDAYMKSGWRHFFDWWELHRAGTLTPEQEVVLEDALTALLFNVQGYLHEHLKRKRGSEVWLFEQAVQSMNEETEKRRLLLNRMVDGMESVPDTYTPDLQPVDEGSYRGEPDPVTRGFAFHRHLEGNSPPVESVPPRKWWQRDRIRQA